MFAFVVSFSNSVLCQKIGWVERLRNDLFLCWVGRKTLTQSISLDSSCDKEGMGQWVNIYAAICDAVIQALVQGMHDIRRHFVGHILID